MDKIQTLAKMIDHSLLHPTMTDQQLLDGCEIAKAYDVASVCIKPYAVPLALKNLDGSGVLVGTVIGFPQGNSTINMKVKEASEACTEGAAEIDMVVNIGKVLQQDWDYINEEIQAVNDVVKKQGAVLKVIFENDFLPTDDFKISLCKICSNIAVDFVKTSTGYGFVKGEDGKYSYLGATKADLILMRKHSDPAVQIKAAGGIRTLDDLLAVRELGVTRVGATATVKILEEAKARFGQGSDPLAVSDDIDGY